MALIRAKDLPNALTTLGSNDYFSADEGSSGETKKVNIDAIKNAFAKFSEDQYFADNQNLANLTYISPSPALSTLIVGMKFKIKKGNLNNDGSFRVGINAITPIYVKKNGTEDLQRGDLKAGQIFEVEYDGTFLQLTSGLYNKSNPDWVDIIEYLPVGYQKDGSSVSYVSQINTAITYAVANGKKGVKFPPITFLIDSPDAIELKTGRVYNCEGTVFKVKPDQTAINADGAIFFGNAVSNITFIGGSFLGNRDSLLDSVNICGIRLSGVCANINIKDVSFDSLSSNGIRIHGTDINNMSTNIFISDCYFTKCCNKYYDYTENPPGGPYPGTGFDDQGNISLYYVNTYEVTKCKLTNSRSDGSHFVNCINGRFDNNYIYNNKMGGYFQEGCEEIIISNNIMYLNGSRGITFEPESVIFQTGRKNINCILSNNISRKNGRDGAWIRDTQRCNIIGNIFDQNGTKDDDGRDYNLFLDEENDDGSSYDILVEGNTSITSATQENAFRIECGGDGIVVKNNLMRGSVKGIRSSSWFNGLGNTYCKNNIGWNTEKRGIITFSGNGSTSTFQFYHGLDWTDPTHNEILNYLKIYINLEALSYDASKYHRIVISMTQVTIYFLNAPPAGTNNIQFQYEAKIRY